MALDAERPLRLAAAAAAMGIDAPTAAGTITRLLGYLDAMLERNKVQNLTAVRDPAAAEVLHVLDSLALGLFGLDPLPQRVLDLGSGNGFPGVAAAALWPGAEVLLMERTGKKARAIGELLASCTGFERARVLHGDATQLPALQPELKRSVDLVTVRAVGAPEIVADLAKPFVRPEGLLVLWLDHGAMTPEELPGYEEAGELDYELPEPAARQRRLGIWRRR